VANAKVEFGKASVAYAKKEPAVADARLRDKKASYEMEKLKLLEANQAAKNFDADKIRGEAASAHEAYAQVDGANADLKKRRDESKNRFDQLQAKLDGAKAVNPLAGKTPNAPVAQPGVLTLPNGQTPGGNNNTTPPPPPPPPVVITPASAPSPAPPLKQP